MKIENLIKEAFEEDIPDGDITTDSLPTQEKMGRAQLIAKEDLVLSGSEIFEKCVLFQDENTEVKWHINDGQHILAGQTVASIIGNLIGLLKSERIALNFLGHLSGIASYTRCFVDQVEGKCEILDTRKTTPLLRSLEKKAVKDGGGQNHRHSLSDKILIKENHLSINGGIKETLNCLKEKELSDFEIEVRTEDEAYLAAELGAKHLLLDNMNNETMTRICEKLGSSFIFEASGNMTLDRVKGVAETGVNYISIGALTHSAPCADFSILFDWK